jgi:TrpR-related protein YerC/YecD
MKRRSLEPEQLDETAVRRLCRALLAVDEPEDMQALLTDLCTPAELEALADRWQVVPYILEAVPYREIHDRTAVSVTTIGRVARCLTAGAGGYQIAVKKLKRRGAWPLIEREEAPAAVLVVPETVTRRSRASRSVRS